MMHGSNHAPSTLDMFLQANQSENRCNLVRLACSVHQTELDSEAKCLGDMIPCSLCRHIGNDRVSSFQLHGCHQGWSCMALDISTLFCRNSLLDTRCKRSTPEGSHNPIIPKVDDAE